MLRVMCSVVKFQKFNTEEISKGEISENCIVFFNRAYFFT